MSNASDCVQHTFSLDDATSLHYQRLLVRDDGGRTPLQGPLVDCAFRDVNDTLARVALAVLGAGGGNRTYRGRSMHW